MEGRVRGRLHARALGALCAVMLLGAATRPESPVADAAQRGDVARVRALLRDGADVNAAQGDGMTALHWSAERHDPELAKILVYAGAHVDAGTRIGNYTPLDVACREGALEVAKVLLDAGADPTQATSNSGATPLHLAAASGNAELVTELVRRGADPDAREASWGQTPLIFAAAANRVDAIRALVAAGADPNARARSVDTRVEEKADNAALKQLNATLADFKKDEGGGPEWQPSPAEVQAAIEMSRQIQRNWPNVPENTDAAKEAAKPAAPAADEAGAQKPSAEKPATPKADAKAADTDDKAEGGDEDEKPMSYGELVQGWGGLTPLLHAVRQGHVEATMALLDAGADINETSSGDHTSPLLMAALNGQWDLGMILIQKGADPNIASVAGTTPLYAVIEREWEPRSSYSHPTDFQQQETTHLEIMKALLDAGADPNARLNRHLWYMEYTFQVLKGSGIDLKGATPFWRAAYALDVDAMRLLKQHGADTNIATMKPPERRRPQAPPKEEKKPAEGADSVAGAEGAAAAAAPADEAKPKAKPAEEEDDPDKDYSGLPPVPVNGPALYPIHAASGAGYGISFAGNAHRYVPDGWMPAIKFLIEECHADVNQRDANGYTALHNAAARGDVEMIKYLVEHGADVGVVSRKGQTTADMANGPVQRVQPFPEALELLEKLGAKNNHKCVSC